MQKRKKTRQKVFSEESLQLKLEFSLEQRFLRNIKGTLLANFRFETISVFVQKP